jgi:hypothetical protein
MMKDATGGVQPIEYMLNLPGQPADYDAGRPAVAERAADGAAGKGDAEKRARWSLDEVVPLPGAARPPKNYPFGLLGQSGPNPRLGVDEEAARIRPLATPLMMAGISGRCLDEFAPIFRAYGLVPLQAGGVGGTVAADATAEHVKLERGSVLTVPLMTGDIDMTVVGTCTEVIGDRIFGFGHSFNSEGPVSLPMGTGQIATVIANLTTSFKLGSLLDPVGTLVADQTVGVSGRVGKLPAMVPIEIRVKYADGSEDQTYHFDAAVHPRFTPLLVAAAFVAAAGGAKEFPQYHTLDYDLNMAFANGRSLQINNTLVNASAGDVFFEMGTPLLAATDNPFERVWPKKITGTVRVLPEARDAKILSVNVLKLKYKAGETVKAFVTYRPFRSPEAVLPIEFDLPRDLPEGTYQLSVTDWQKYLEQERAANAFRFVAENAEQVFDVLKDLSGVKHDALYLRLLRQPDGVAIGRTAMPHLPSSRRMVLMDAGRSNTLPFVSTTVKVIPTELVMSGSADFLITIEPDAKVQVAGPANKPAAPAAAPGGAKPADGKQQGAPPAKSDPSKAEPTKK